MILEAFSKLNDAMERFVERAGHNQQMNKAAGLDPPTHRGPPTLRSAPTIPPWSIPHFSLQEVPEQNNPKVTPGKSFTFSSCMVSSLPCSFPLSIRMSRASA